jgi:hypothetical protein
MLTSAKRGKRKMTEEQSTQAQSNKEWNID